MVSPQQQIKVEAVAQLNLESCRPLILDDS
jgi:hypothetical protein